MAGRDWGKGRFDEADAEPMGPMANLVDIMLVFAVGLIAALAASQGGESHPLKELSKQEVTQGRELPEVPEGVGGAKSKPTPATASACRRRRKSWTLASARRKMSAAW